MRRTWLRERASSPDAEALFAQADLIVKVKEPLQEEYLRLEPRHVLFTFLHLAPDAELTRGLLDSGATCLAYETVETTDGRQPLLAPMSEIAGQAGAAGGSLLPGAQQRGEGQAPRRSHRREGGQRRDPRSRYRRVERGRHRRRHGSPHKVLDIRPGCAGRASAATCPMSRRFTATS